MINKPLIYGPEEGDQPTVGAAGDGDLATEENALTTETSSDEEVYNTDEELAQALFSEEPEEEYPEPDPEPIDEEAEPEEEPPDPEVIDEEAEPEEEATEQTEETEETEETLTGEYEDDEDVAFKDFPKELRPKMRKLISATVSDRVGKEIAKTRAATEERDTLKTQTDLLQAQLTQLKADKVMPQFENGPRLSDVTTNEQLDQAISEIRSMDDWLDLNIPLLVGTEEVEDPATGMYSEQPKKVKCDLINRELTLKEAQDLKLEVKRDLEAIQDRRQYISQNADYDQWLNDRVPSLNDQNSELSLQVNEAISRFPEVKRFPGYRASMLYYTVGRRVMESLDGEGNIEQFLGSLGKSDPKQKQTVKQPAKKQPPKKVAARPVPAVRRAVPKTTRPAEPDAYESMDELVEALQT